MGLLETVFQVYYQNLWKPDSPLYLPPILRQHLRGDRGVAAAWTIPHLFETGDQLIVRRVLVDGLDTLTSAGPVVFASGLEKIQLPLAAKHLHIKLQGLYQHPRAKTRLTLDCELSDLAITPTIACRLTKNPMIKILALRIPQAPIVKSLRLSPPASEKLARQNLGDLKPNAALPDRLLQMAEEVCNRADVRAQAEAAVQEMYQSVAHSKRKAER